MTKVTSAAAVFAALYYCLATCQMLLHSTSCIWWHDGQAAALWGVCMWICEHNVTSKPPKQTSSVARVFKHYQGRQSRSSSKDSRLLELKHMSHTGQDDTMLPIRGLLLPVKDLLMLIKGLLLPIKGLWPHELVHLALNLSFAQDLRDLFRVVPSELEGSETQHTLHQLHSHQRKATPYVLDHLHFLETLPRYAGTHTLSCLLCLNDCTFSSCTVQQPRCAMI